MYSIKKRIITCFLIILLFTSGKLSAQGLPPVYHTPEEITQELQYIDSVYSGIAHMELIGYSEHDSIPFYGIHISDNPEIEEEEPGFLLLGQCHAEEVLGVEISLRFLRELCEKYATDVHVRTLVRECSIWIIPTYNPEGLKVVHDSLDVTYRKNKHDNNLNGEFDYEVGIGYDIDGVDLNRNYDFHWIHGDGYLVGDYDYYRGPAPFSETETQAIRNFTENHTFLFSVAYHSARSGTPEIIYYPWDWEGNKRPPDYPQIREIATELASRIKRENEVDHYRLHAGTSRKGNAHNWFYGVRGVFQYLIECGTNNLQPDSAGVESVISHNLPGLYYLLDRMIGYDVPAPMLTGKVVDALTDEPLSAVIEIEGLESEMVRKRYSRASDGRFWRILSPGTYTICVKRFGYLPSTVEDFVINESFPTFVNIPLIPLQNAVVSFNLETEISNPLNFTLYQDNVPVISDSSLMSPFVQEIPPGDYFYTITDNDSLFFVDSVRISQDTVITNTLRKPVIVMREDFSDLEGWTISDTLRIWNSITDSTGRSIVRSNHDPFYPNNYKSTLVMDSTISIPDSGLSYLVLKHKFCVEPEYDSIGVDIAVKEDSSLWNPLAKWKGERRNFQSDIFDMQKWMGKDIVLRFWIRSDGTLNDPGWFIDDLFLVNYDTTHISQSIDNSSVPSDFSVSFAYPNPFNTSTIFYVKALQDVRITVFDLLGRTVISETMKFSGTGRTGEFRLNGAEMATGIYFVKFQSGKKTRLRKCLLIK